MKKIVRRDGLEISLGQWMSTVRTVEGIRFHEGRGFDGIGEVFDPRFAEWFEVFVWREGVIVVNDATPGALDRVLGPLLAALDADLVDVE